MSNKGCALLLALLPCPFQESDVPRALPHQCREGPGAALGRGRQSGSPGRFTPSRRGNPSQAGNICSQLGWGTPRAEQALCASPRPEPFAAKAPGAGCDLMGWEWGGRGWGSPWVSPLPIPAAVLASIPASVPAAVPAPHHDAAASRAERCGTHRPPDCTANETVSTARNYFPGRRMINSCSGAAACCKFTRAIIRQAPCRHPGQRMLHARESLSEIWLKKALTLACGCCPSPKGLGSANEGPQLHPGPHWVPRAPKSLQELSASHQT